MTDVAGLYIGTTRGRCDNMAGVMTGKWLLMSLNDCVTLGIYWVNGKVPRGPVQGCHVAPLYWSLDIGKSLGSRESTL
jgi:hypothetical protein